MNLAAEPLVGFRSWRIAGNALQPLSYSSETMWAPRDDVRADCSTVKLWMLRRHSAPLRSCTCGIHAHYANDPARKENGCCWGAIVAWGRIIECEHGFRAEYARPIAFLEQDEPNIALVAAHYELPILPLDELEQYGHMFGEIRTEVEAA